jgi:predicted permease
VNTAIFSVLNAALLESMPVRNPNELVMLTNPNASMVLGGLTTGERYLLTFPEFAQLRDRTRTLSGVCTSQVTLERWSVRIAGSSPEQRRGRLVGENYFSVLGVQPVLGRFFSQADATGVGKDPYAVISYDYWKERFGGNPAILGTPIRLRRTTFVIIGVAAKGFRGETVGQEPAMWLPLLMQPQVMPGSDGLRGTIGQSENKLMWLHVFGRRKAGVTIPQVQAEISVLFRAILKAGYPASMQAHAQKEFIAVRPMGGGVFHGRKEFSEQWTLLSLLAGLVLTVACVNVANLLLARAAARTREVAIRLSISAARSRLMRQFLTESLLLTLLGGIAGLLVAGVVLRGLVRVLSDANEGFAIAAAINLHVLEFSAFVTLLTGIFCGLAPALRVTRSTIHENLKETRRGATGSRERVSFARVLVGAQIALSLLLVIGAGLFLRTLWNLQTVAIGYPRDKLLLIQVDSWNAGYRGERAANLSRELVTRITELPGVHAVSHSARGLFSGSEGAAPVEVEGFTSQKEEDRGSTIDSVGPE